MSSRAIRRLREERTVPTLDPEEVIEEEDDDEITERKQPAFLAMMDSDSEEESQESEEEEQPQLQEETVTTETKQDLETTVEKPQGNLKNDTEAQEEDLDALLAEFESQDQDVSEDTKPSAPWFNVILSSLDARDLDIDFVMRTSLLAGADEAPAASRRTRQSFLFGPPRDGWVRPPHYVGGGLGMTSYDDIEPRSLPWPYSTTLEDAPDLQDPKKWFTFLQSDTYKKDLQDYERIQNSGDVNALALYVAHHPFIVEALLQLAMVLYRTNQSQEGLSLLRRSIWILECSSLSSFRPLQGKACFLDYDQSENAPYFLALFRMMQVSGMVGCLRTSLAVSRYLLALDPLRDPMGVLLLMDYFALASLNESYDQFVVNLVESKKIELYYRDESTQQEYYGHLLDLPNWAYSYALALYRLSMPKEDTPSNECNVALQSAVRRFPSVVEELLIRNEVEMTGRSMRSDWPTVLRDLRLYAINPFGEENYDPIMQHAASQAGDLIAKIFVQRNSSLWSGDNVLMWLYRNCTALLPEGAVESLSRQSLCPALVRYASCDPSDYEDRFQTLPQDANPLDPGLLAPALAVDPNRRRFLQRADMPVNHEQAAAAPMRGLVIGGPPTNAIDPDSPILEVLWRSALPWNRVDGVPPPRR